MDIVSVNRAGKLNKPANQLNWVVLMEQMRAFVKGFTPNQVKEDPMSCEFDHTHHLLLVVTASVCSSL